MLPIEVQHLQGYPRRAPPSSKRISFAIEVSSVRILKIALAPRDKVAQRIEIVEGIPLVESIPTVEVQKAKTEARKIASFR
jgi:hypothetical protein